jgi:PhnB protein
MRSNTYLVFDGNCREAMKFYQRCLGGELQFVPASEMPGGAPEGNPNRIVHSMLRNGDVVWMGMDNQPGLPYRPGNNFLININCGSVEEINRVFAALALEGKITMPLQETFFADRFGMLTDRFGISWILGLEKAGWMPGKTK